MGSRRSPRRGKDIVGDEFCGAVYDTFRVSRSTLLFISEGERSLSLSFSSPNLTNALRFALSVAFYPTSRIVRVPLLRSESTRVEFLIHPPLFPLFFSRHVFLSACYDFSLFFFSLFLRGHSLCNNFPVVLACVLCTFLFPSPYVELFRRFENFYRAYILPPPRKKIPFMQFFKLPSIFIPESSRANHVSLITRVSLSLSLFL